MAKNELILRKIKTKSEFFNKLAINDYQGLIDTIRKTFVDPGIAVAYLNYTVLVGKYENETLYFYKDQSFEIKQLQRLRVFNENKELLLWLKNETYNARLRVDGVGELLDVVDAGQILWGTDVVSLDNGWSLVYEARGTELILPLKGMELDKGKKRLKLKTRNYICANEVGQAGYFDSRFVSIEGDYDG